MTDSDTATSTEYADRDEQYLAGVQRGEFAAAVGAGTVALVVGLWVGVWMIPDAALAVPTAMKYGEAVAAYQPVPNHLPAMSVVVVAIGAWGARSFLRTPSERDERAETGAATDGGETATTPAAMRRMEMRKQIERLRAEAEDKAELEAHIPEIAANAYKCGYEAARREGGEVE